MYCDQASDLKLSKGRKVSIFLIGVIESMLFAGIVFGWPQIVHVLKLEGIYQDLCQNSSLDNSSLGNSSLEGQELSLIGHNLSLENLSLENESLKNISLGNLSLEGHNLSLKNERLKNEKLEHLSLGNKRLTNLSLEGHSLSLKNESLKNESLNKSSLDHLSLKNESLNKSSLDNLSLKNESLENESLKSAISLVSTQSSRELYKTHIFSTTSTPSKDNDMLGSCPAQDERFALIFTLTVGCYSVPGIFIGYLLHHAGLRVTRISAGTMLSLSFIFLGVSTKENPDYLFAAMILMALGGNQLRMSVMQLGDLFPSRRSTAITLLSGMYAASASVFLIFQFTASAGIERAHVCYVMAGISSLTIFTSFIMPVHHIPVKESYIHIVGVKPPCPPLSSSFWSISSMLHQWWFFINLLCINIYQQTYNVWVNLSSETVEEVTLYSMMFSYSNLITIFIGPTLGMITDYLVRQSYKIPNELTRRVKEIQASFIPLLITSVATIIMYICKFVFNETAVYISLICMVISRPCVIAVSTAYIRIRFPADHFNRLLGIHGTVASILMFLQYPHFIWSEHMYYVAHGFTLALLIISLTNPFHLLIRPYMKRAVIERDQLRPEELLPKGAFGDEKAPL